MSADPGLELVAYDSLFYGFEGLYYKKHKTEQKGNTKSLSCILQAVSFLELNKDDTTYAHEKNEVNDREEERWGGG
jgi:uncharacterized protein YtpQ (UPF0354 family)